MLGVPCTAECWVQGSLVRPGMLDGYADMVCRVCLVLLRAACTGQSQGRQHPACPGWGFPGKAQWLKACCGDVRGCQPGTCKAGMTGQGTLGARVCCQLLARLYNVCVNTSACIWVL